MNACAVLAALFLVASSPAPAQDTGRPYWIDAWRGWHFYEDPVDEDLTARLPSRQRAATAPTRPPAKPSRLPELVEFDRLQAELDDARKVAVVSPTETNVRRYMELEAEVVSRASTFADVAQRVAWAIPQLDPTTDGRPVNAMALEVFEQQRLIERSRSIGALGRDHVLLFFFRSDCPYCHAFAPTLADFQARHGIRVEAVSLDGGPLPGFPEARRDNGIASTLRVSQVPAVYLAQPFAGTITPIGFGVLSEAQLVERIVTVSTPSYRSMLPSVTQQVAPRPAMQSLTAAVQEARP